MPLSRRVLILEPAFVEYSRALAAVNAQVTTALLTEERGLYTRFCEPCAHYQRTAIRFSDCKLPSQSTGALYPRDALLTLIDAAEEYNAAVLL